MPTIIACFKWVVDEAYIRRTASGELDFSSVDYKIGEYDRNAIEEAVRLKETLGGNAIGVTIGVPEATKGAQGRPLARMRPGLLHRRRILRKP